MTTPIGFWIQEAAQQGDTEDGIPLLDALQKIRDEVSIIGVKGHGYGSRSLAMICARLDEAIGWAREYAINESRTHLFIDKRRYAAQLESTKDLAVTTDKTDRSRHDAG